MSRTSTGVFSRSSSLPLTFVIALIVYCLLQYTLAPHFFSSYTPKDADDAMRLLAARDLLAGQSWFDTRQMRVLPPDGLHLHWSRFIDAALAGLMWIFGLFLPQALAERATAAVWPAILFVVYLVICGRAARAAGGNSAASFAMLGAASLVVLNVAFFAFGRVDHHNVQLISMVFICGTVLSQGDVRKVSMIGGAVAGFSLAVGLETLPFIILTGLILVIDFCNSRPVAHDRLLGFGIGLAGSATVFFFLQTPPGTYGALRCDTLGIPMSFLPVGAGVYAFALCLAGRGLSGPLSRFGLAALLAVIWIGIIWFPLMQCAEGPYANVAPEIREMVINRVSENHSALTIWKSNFGRAFSQFFPIIIVALLLLPGAVRRKSRAHRILLAYVLLGMLGALLQMRLLIWAVALMPVVFGLVISELVNRPWPGLWFLKPFLIIPLAVVILIPPLGAWALSQLVGDRMQPLVASGQMDQRCNRRAELLALNDIPPALILTTLNLGAPVLYNTHHSVTSVPYHRSPIALISGIAPFQATPKELLDEMENLGAQYILVCSGERYGAPESGATMLAAGEILPELLEVELDAHDLMLFRRE